MLRAVLKEVLVALISLSVLMGVAGFGLRDADRKRVFDESTRAWRSAFSDIEASFREVESDTESGRFRTPCRGNQSSIIEVERGSVESWLTARICLAFGIIENFPRTSWEELRFFASQPFSATKKYHTLSRLLAEPEVRQALANSTLVSDAGGEKEFEDLLLRFDMIRADEALSDVDNPEFKPSWSRRQELSPKRKEGDGAVASWRGVLDDLKRIHLAHLRVLEGQVIAESSSIGALLAKPFVNWPRRFNITLLFVGAVTLAIMVIAHLMVVWEIQQSHTRRLIFLFSLPTFVVSLGLIETFGIRSVPPHATPVFLRYIFAFFCLALASGILFEVVQVFQTTARKELNSSHVAGLKTFGVARGSRDQPLSWARSTAIILRYFGWTAVEVIRGRRAMDASASGKVTDSGHVVLPPLVFRALAYHDLELVKRRFSYLLDAMIVVAILFGLHDTVVGGFVDSVAAGGLTGLLELVIGVVLIGTVFRLLGTIIWYRLFT